MGKTTNCQNCKRTIIEKYCSHCGQKTNTKRITWKYLVKEVPESIFQLNHGFFYTVKGMAVKPGIHIRAFIEGKRKPYYKPLAFLLLCFTIYIVTYTLVGVNTAFEDAILGIESSYSDSGNLNNDVPVFIHWFRNNLNLVLLFLVPVYALGTVIAFRKSTFNYVEWLVFHCYVLGMQLLFYIPFVFVIPLHEEVFINTMLLVGFLYYYLAINQFFKENTWMKNVFLFLYSYVLLIVILFVFMFVVRTLTI